MSLSDLLVSRQELSALQDLPVGQGEGAPAAATGAAEAVAATGEAAGEDGDSSQGATLAEIMGDEAVVARSQPGSPPAPGLEGGAGESAGDFVAGGVARAAEARRDGEGGQGVEVVGGASDMAGKAQGRAECECLFHVMALLLPDREPVEGWGGAEGEGGELERAERLKELVTGELRRTPQRYTLGLTVDEVLQHVDGRFLG